MGTNSEPGPGTILTKGAATDAIISASCRYNGSGQHRLWYWQTCVCVCEKVYVGLGQTCVCVHCEVNGTGWRRSGLWGRLRFLGLCCTPCMHACICTCAIHVYLTTWPRPITARQPDQSSVPCSEFRGIAESVSHLVPNFSGCSAVGLKLCSIQLNQGCSGHLDNQKPVRVGSWKKGGAQ